jgi:CubicO group peptidase (beta-lactamase class C family)
MKNTIQLNDGHFPTSAPEDQGISSADIAALLQDLEERSFDLHSVQIVRNGRLCFSAAAAPFTLDSPHRAYSATKGIIAAAVLFAIQEGKIRFDDIVVDFFRDELPDHLDERYRRLTVYHMLTMQVGQASDAAFLHIIFEDPNGDLVRCFFGTPMIDEPGTKFSYNNAVPQMLCYIVERATGIAFEEYLRSHLCEPLGIDVVVQHSNGGNYEPSTSVLSSNSFLKVALFFLQEGAWNGEQLLDPALARSAGAFHVPTGARDPGYSNGKGYGLQLWRNAFGGYRFDGGRGQYAIVVPDEDLVTVFVSNELEPAILIDVFYERVFSRMRRLPLTPSAEAASALDAALRRFSLAPLDAAPASPVLASIDGHAFSFVGNELGLESFRLESSGDGVRLSIRITGRDESAHCGLGGRWSENVEPFLFAPDMSHSNAIYTMDPNRVLLSGGWLSDSVFVFKLRSLASLGEYAVRCDFSRGGLALDVPRRVSIGKEKFEDAVRLVSARVD